MGAAQIQTGIQRGILAGTLGMILSWGAAPGMGLVPSAKVSTVEPLWTFTVDQCANDLQEPHIQEEQDHPPEGFQQACAGKHRSQQTVLSSGTRSFWGLWAGKPPSPPTDSGGQDFLVTEVQVQTDPETGTLQFQYSRVMNCCAYIEFVPEQHGQVLEVREKGIVRDTCRCTCPFIAEGTVNNLSPGSYTLRVFGDLSQWEVQGSEWSWVEKEAVLFERSVQVSAPSTPSASSSPTP